MILQLTSVTVAQPQFFKLISRNHKNPSSFSGDLNEVFFFLAAAQNPKTWMT